MIAFIVHWTDSRGSSHEPAAIKPKQFGRKLDSALFVEFQMRYYGRAYEIIWNSAGIASGQITKKRKGYETIPAFHGMPKSVTFELHIPPSVLVICEHCLSRFSSLTSIPFDPM
jgi:hypothetical protein